MSSSVMSTSASPDQVGSTACPCRYSSAARPTAAALTRSGMSLLTSVTSQPFRRESKRDRQDAGVVRLIAEARRKQLLVGVVQLHPQRAALVVDRQRHVEPAVLDPQIVELAKGLPREPAQLGMVPLALQLGDDHQREHHVVLGEAAQGSGVGQQNGSV